MTDRKPIMVVEDDPAVRQLIAEILLEAGHEVVECASAEDALVQLDSVHPAAITLDLAMPSMDGIQFLSMLKERAGAAQIPVVVVTAAPEFVREALSGRGQPTVGKPFYIDQLLSAVQHALGRHQATA